MVVTDQRHRVQVFVASLVSCPSDDVEYVGFGDIVGVCDPRTSRLFTADARGVRDTKDRSYGPLAFDADAWAAFVATIKSGTLDLR